MLLIKPKDTRFYKRRLKSNLSFLRLSLFDKSIRLTKESNTGMKVCNWLISCSAVTTEIMICRAKYVNIMFHSMIKKRQQMIIKTINI
jgi:hypothetical protein